MAHTSQVRYAALVDAKLRATMVKKDEVIFSTRYEGNPKAGTVKIPVRDTEVSVQAYDKASGVSGTRPADKAAAATKKRRLPGFPNRPKRPRQPEVISPVRHR